MDQNLLIDLKTPTEEFNKSLNLPDNTRIIFSGPFGTGKTYFLKHFFGETDKYIALHIYPVNYSVSKNEDIFELVKYDILYELLKHNVELEKIDLSFLNTILFVSDDDQIKMLPHFLSLIPRFGKSVLQVVQPIKNIRDIIAKRKKEISKDEAKELEALSNQMDNRSGSIYEFDFISGLISDLVNRLKEKNRKVVLVIDDVDRIDPDHIFRLLNVFSSHIDFQQTDRNKFSLDKVIISCDVDNIRNIFHNKFGQNVDFSGYIDKFYSVDIFHFNNRKVVSRSISKILASVRIDDRHLKYFNLREAQNIHHSVCKYFLSSLVSSNSINLRKLLKLCNKEYAPSEYTVMGMSNKLVPIVCSLDFLVTLFGDPSELNRTIEKSNFSLKSDGSTSIQNEILELCGQLVLLSEIDVHRFKSDRSGKLVNSLVIGSSTYRYRIEQHTYGSSFTAKLIDSDGFELDFLSEVDIRPLIMKTYKSYLTLKSN